MAGSFGAGVMFDLPVTVLLDKEVPINAWCFVPSGPVHTEKGSN